MLNNILLLRQHPWAHRAKAAWDVWPDFWPARPAGVRRPRVPLACGPGAGRAPLVAGYPPPDPGPAAPARRGSAAASRHSPERWTPPAGGGTGAWRSRRPSCRGNASWTGGGTPSRTRNQIYFLQPLFFSVCFFSFVDVYSWRILRQRARAEGTKITKTETCQSKTKRQGCLSYKDWRYDRWRNFTVCFTHLLPFHFHFTKEGAFIT